MEIRDTDIEGFRVTPDVVSTVRGRLHGDTDSNTDWSGFAVALSSDEISSDLWDRIVSGTQFNVDVKRDGAFEIKAVPAGTYARRCGPVAQAIAITS